MYTTRHLPNTRIDVADALRGIAVAGIILYHSVEHFNIFTKETIIHTLPTDQAVSDVLAWLLSGKMGAFVLRTFCLAHVSLVSFWCRKRGFLRWRYPDALRLLWSATYSYQLSAV